MKNFFRKLGRHLENLKNKLKLTWKVFMDGFSAQAGDDGTMTLSIATGLWMGLKYTGNLQRGLVSGGLTYLIISTCAGIRNVFKNRDYIERSYGYVCPY